MLAALLALAGIECAVRAMAGPPSPLPSDIDDFDRSHAPDLLVLGDSKVGTVDFRDLAAACDPGNPPTGLVWSMPGTSATAMLESLLQRGVSPGTLLVSVSPETLLLNGFLAEGRARMETPDALKAGTRPLRRAMAGLHVIPDESGPSALSRSLLGSRSLFIDPERWERERAVRIRESRRQLRAHHMANTERWFAEEPHPSREAIEAAILAIRSLQQRGIRVVLVRTPVSPEMLAREDAWGTREALERIAETAGVPLTDMNAQATYAPLVQSVQDHRHVEGERMERLLSAELGRICRQGTAR